MPVLPFRPCVGKATRCRQALAGAVGLSGLAIRLRFTNTIKIKQAVSNCVALVLGIHI